MREKERKRDCMRVKKSIYISRTFIYREFCSTVKLASFKGRGKHPVFDIDPDCLFGIDHIYSGRRL